MNNKIKARLNFLRDMIETENISYGEIAELQSLAKYIDKDDVSLLEWAGVPEVFSSKCEQCGKDQDLLVAFSDNKICGDCTRKNHKQATV